MCITAFPDLIFTLMSGMELDVQILDLYVIMSQVSTTLLVFGLPFHPLLLGISKPSLSTSSKELSSAIMLAVYRVHMRFLDILCTVTCLSALMSLVLVASNKRF